MPVWSQRLAEAVISLATFEGLCRDGSVSDIWGEVL